MRFSAIRECNHTDEKKENEFLGSCLPNATSKSRSEWRFQGIAITVLEVSKKNKDRIADVIRNEGGTATLRRLQGHFLRNVAANNS
jgi:hypothetical protein